MTKVELAKVLAVLGAAYPKWTFTPELPEVYYQLLGDIDGEIVMTATKRWAMTEKWPPTVADLRNACAQTCGLLAPSPERAWAEVVTAIKTNQREWSHPAVAEAVKTMTWWELTHSENVTTTRAHFLKVYADYQRSADTATVLSPALSAGNHATLTASPVAELTVDSDDSDNSDWGLSE